MADKPQPLGDLQVIGDAPVSTSTAIAGLALTFAMKFHDTNTIKDGVMYQQMKLEGANITGLHLDDVLATARKLEAWVLGADERISGILVEMLDQMEEDAEASK